LNRSSFTSPFCPTSLPVWRCPACADGALTLVKDSLHKEETAESKRTRSDPNWDQDWVCEQFSALLRCSKCKEPVFIVGTIKVAEGQDQEDGWVLFDALAPTYFHPPTPIIRIPGKCPSEVVSEINAASGLYWSSPPSAGNRIRAALERLMDDQGIPKKKKTKKGKYEDLTLHARIERFAKKQPDVGGNLLAIKWLGNSGSHSDNLTADDMLDAFELLTHALEEIYESKSTRIMKLTTSIIKKKGPVKR
jgi:hypothetical protein